VTAAAEVGYVFSAEIAQIAKSGGHHGLAAAPGHGCKMRLSGFVTMTVGQIMAFWSRQRPCRARPVGWLWNECRKKDRSSGNCWYTSGASKSKMEIPGYSECQCYSYAGRFVRHSDQHRFARAKG
jgi:hypothetical protein